MKVEEMISDPSRDDFWDICASGLEIYAYSYEKFRNRGVDGLTEDAINQMLMDVKSAVIKLIATQTLHLEREVEQEESEVK